MSSSFFVFLAVLRIELNTIQSFECPLLMSTFFKLTSVLFLVTQNRVAHLTHHITALIDSSRTARNCFSFSFKELR